SRTRGVDMGGVPTSCAASDFLQRQSVPRATKEVTSNLRLGMDMGTSVRRPLAASYTPARPHEQDGTACPCPLSRIKLNSAKNAPVNEAELPFGDATQQAATKSIIPNSGNTRASDSL